VLCGSLFAATLPCAAQAADFDNWPVSYDVGGGNTFAFTGNFAYDYNGFSGDDRLEDKDFMRRKEFGATLKKAGVYDAMVYFDFQSHTWLDVYLRMETKALFGKDVGKIRVGYIKTPVGMDALTASRSVSMQELSLPNQAFSAGRRTGVEWSQEKPHWFAQIGAYGGKDLQGDNAAKLELMRQTVDEKLQSTLNTRLDSSFKLVSERLEQVQRGLGEMQQLATGVGDLKRVLSNVKNRGGWGEVQLDNILEQTLTAEQYARGVKLRADSGEMVDFAVRLPGRGDGDTPVWLPIDSKFPREDYERLLDAQEAGDVEAVRNSGNQLERAIRIQAKSISDKYIVPPHSTDFAVMFLPTEGLYAEIIRRAGLVDALQREHRVVIAGPTTVTALLNSLQMGFRTLAIEQRSSEVWSLLGAVKSEFGKFAGILEKAEKQINTVGKSLGDASRKTRTIERKLRGVESLSSDASQAMLGTDDEGEEDSPESSES